MAFSARIQSLLVGALLLPSVLCSISFAPKDFPISTINNDGTRSARYDVRKTLTFVENKPGYVNNWYFILWVTTEDDGTQYEITINQGLRGNNSVGNFVMVNDITNAKSVFADSKFAQGSASESSLAVLSPMANVSSPSPDNFTILNSALRYDGFQLDVSTQPTGLNMYFGNGGFVIDPSVNRNQYATAPPGWSWYWCNPHLRVLSGSMTLQGKTKKFNVENSFASFERQYGDFSASTGYVAYWLYLSNGIVIQTWLIDPTPEGRGTREVTTVWHPDGVHEIVPVSEGTRSWDTWTSHASNYTYFSSFTLSLEARGAELCFKKTHHATETTARGAGPSYPPISESFIQGEGVWEGEWVTIIGHTEQLVSPRSQ